VLTRPTTEQVLAAVARELGEVVLPAVSDEPVRVALQMMVQLLAGCAQRAAHEIAWMHEEIAAIESAVDDIDDEATRVAVAALRAAPTGSLHLDDVVRRYHLASEALAAAVEHAYRIGDGPLAVSLRELLLARNANEMTVVGRLDLVGRG
jgi:hypothetical protein